MPHGFQPDLFKPQTQSQIVVMRQRSDVAKPAIEHSSAVQRFENVEQSHQEMNDSLEHAMTEPIHPKKPM